MTVNIKHMIKTYSLSNKNFLKHCTLLHILSPSLITIKIVHNYCGGIEKVIGGVSTDTAFAKKLFFNLFVLDFKTLYLFPDGKETNILYPGWVWSTIMLLALVRNLLTYIVSRLGSSVPIIHCAVLTTWTCFFFCCLHAVYSYWAPNWWFLGNTPSLSWCS